MEELRIKEALKYAHIINRDVLYTGGKEVGKEYIPTTGVLAAIDWNKLDQKVSKKIYEEFELIAKKGDN